ncbi:abc transporter family protein [Stylonychia lemnae]|uniref:Abc transporter family protein n=1 Tax=Stylonychia lemnae TaxID=5949 RepID=A0A078AGY8_STYLE|nr:abc transporter family protein [Stylonychia lemnae]|eukprot:CDW80123.1 abc transporter family protein [Stylonychia lemnae]
MNRKGQQDFDNADIESFGENKYNEKPLSNIKLANDNTKQNTPVNKSGKVHNRNSLLDGNNDLPGLAIKGQKASSSTNTIVNPVKLTFEDVRFEVTIKLSKNEAREKGTNFIKQEIIKGVSGYAMPGETLYIMGSSGAGKTSLLNILSDRASNKAGTKLSGKLMINDKNPLTQDVFGSIAGYVMQDDILFSYYSPRQALRFAARLKLNNVPEEEQNSKVESLLQELGLRQCADTPIGDQQRKTLSGGERKRVAIGVELITDPSMILLDEPTSGLDSFKALQIVRLLNRQARKGKTVISTIHQPGSDSFALFDRLIYMCDGHIVYQGKASDVASYFKQINIPCPKFANPADFIMRITTVNYPKQPNDEKKVAYLKSQYDLKLQKQIKEESYQGSYKEIDFAERKLSQASAMIQFKELLKRSGSQQLQDPQAFTIKIVYSIFIGLLSLALFWDLSGNNFVTQFGLAGYLFFGCISTLFTHMQGNLLAFQIERPIFLREKANKMYGVLPYYLAKSIIEIPVLVIQPMVWTIVVYFGVGLSITASQFFYYYLILFLLSLSSSSFGMFVSSLFNQQETALAIAPVILMPMIMFSGFFSNASTFQSWISWIQYISPIRYALEAFVWNEFGERKYASNEVDLVKFLGYKIGLATCLWIIAALAIFFRVLTGICLKILAGKFQ